MSTTLSLLVVHLAENSLPKFFGSGVHQVKNQLKYQK